MFEYRISLIWINVKGVFNKERNMYLVADAATPSCLYGDFELFIEGRPRTYEYRTIRL